MKFNWKEALMWLALAILFLIASAKASSFGPSINGSFIIPTTQTYMDAYFKWDIKQINSTRFNASFRIADPMWSDIKTCLALTGASRLNCLKSSCTTSFFHECGLTNCTSYGYTIDVNDTGGLHSANSSTFVYTTNGCYVAPPADTSAPNVTLVSLYFLLKGFGVLA
jgi:hypothetical protein